MTRNLSDIFPPVVVLQLGTTSTTAHRGDHGAAAYTHSQTTGNAHSMSATDVGAIPTTAIGTNPNQIIQLDDEGKLPAVDGSLLTNLPGGTGGSGFGLTTDPATLGVNDDGTLLITRVGSLDPDPYTALLLQFDTTFTDSMDSHTLSPHGAPAVTTTVVDPFGSTGGVLHLDGSSYLTVPDSDDWHIDMGPWTVDLWVNFITVPASGEIRPFAYQQTDGNNKIVVGYAAAEQMLLFGIIGGGSATVWRADWSPIAGIWYHVEIARSGESLYMFINGVPLLVGISTGSASRAVANYTSPLYIGYRPDIALYTHAYIDEYRWSNGIVRHTESFTPRTAPYADAGGGSGKRYDIDPTGLKIAALQAMLERQSWSFTRVSVGDVSGAVALDAADGHMQEMTPTAAVTGLTVSNLGADYPRVELLVVNTAGHAISLGAGWNIFGAIPTTAATFRLILSIRADGTTQDAHVSAEMI